MLTLNECVAASCCQVIEYIPEISNYFTVEILANGVVYVAYNEVASDGFILYLFNQKTKFISYFF